MKILCVHQSAELYGSDRSFLLCVKLLRAKFPEAEITVVLPGAGVLVEHLVPVVTNIIFEDIVVLQRRDMKMLLLNKAWRLACNIRTRILFMRGFDLVYINTVVVLDYILAARFSRAKCIVHVREIPTGLASYLFSSILRFSKACLVFNSDATSNAFGKNMGQERYVLLNGISGYPGIVRDVLNGPELKLLVIGRVNAWKGQRLLLDAVAFLKRERPDVDVRVRIVGSAAKGQDHYVDELIADINAMDLSRDVEYFPFSDSPADHFSWADAVVVPSLKPEPFGLVAIEAMSAGCIVIAARHGGLVEIVEDTVDGYLFSPGSASALAGVICNLIDSREKAQFISKSGRQSFLNKFSMGAFERRFFSMLDSIVRF